MGVQFPDTWAVVVGQKEFSFDIPQTVRQPFVVGFREPVAFVVVLRLVIRGIAVEEGFRLVVLLDEFLEVLVFNDHLLKPSACFVDQREVVPHGVRLAAERIQFGRVAFPDQLIEIRRLPDIRDIRFRMQHLPNVFEVDPGVQRISEFVAQLIRMIAYTPVQIRQIWIEVVVDFKVVARVLMEQDPAASAEHFDVPRIVRREPDNDLVPQSSFTAHPGHETVHLSFSHLAFSGKALCVQTEQKSKKAALCIHSYAKRPLF